MLITIILINIEITINNQDCLLILTKTNFIVTLANYNCFHIHCAIFLLMYNYVHKNKIGPLIHQNSVHLLKE